jgi:hypothetical protein
MFRCSPAGRVVLAIALFGQSPGFLVHASSASLQSGPATSGPVASSSPSASGGVPAGPADAAPFVGDWSIPVTTTFGSYAGHITLKVEEDTVVALLSGDVVPEQRTTDIVKADRGITIRAKMDYEGLLVEKLTPVSVAVTLTPAGDYVNVGMDFRINNKSYFITSTGQRVTP